MEKHVGESLATMAKKMARLTQARETLMRKLQWGVSEAEIITARKAYEDAKDDVIVAAHGTVARWQVWMGEEKFRKAVAS